MTFKKFALNEKVNLPDLGETVAFEDYVVIGKKSYRPNTAFEVVDKSQFEVGLSDGKNTKFFGEKELGALGYYLV